MEKRFRRQAIAMCAVAAAMAASGADFPAPVNGTVTITAAGTYDGDFPSGTVSLAVNVASSETVVVSGDHPSFAGTVTVSGGTLKATSQYALGGENATVSVESGARLWIAFAQPSGTGETSVLWKPKTIIAGSGVAAGGGALKVCFSGSANCDKGVRWLELSDDATVDLSVDSGCKRWGADNLYPRGHTLTRANSSVYFVMRGAANGPGHYVNNAGTMLLQYLAFTSDCTANNTSFTANSGSTLSLWSNTQQNSIPGPIYLRGGAFGYSNSGTSSPSYAWVSGPITYYSGSGITGTGAKKLSHFDGGLVNASTTASFPVTCAGTNWIASLSSTGLGFKFSNAKSLVTGPVAVQGDVRADGAHVEFSGDNDRTMGVYAINGGLFEQTGGRTTARVLRINNGGANYGVFRLAGGSFSTASDQPICGENQGGLGVFVLDGGDFICSNKFTFAKTAGGYGMAVQKGGSFTLRNSGHVAVGNAGDGRYYQLGGTHSAKLSAADAASNIRTGLGMEGGSGQVVVSGNGTVFETGALKAGNASAPSTNTLAIVNGGALKVNRLFAASDSAAGTVSTLYVDGGEIWPGLHSGLSGIGTGVNFTNANFTHAVLGEGGLAVDTSECNDGSGGQGNCDFPHLFSAPTGRGIASITLPAAVAGLKYLGPAPIVIEGPGYGATAFADFDYATMSLTTGVVLSAGCDYDSSTKVYVLGPSGNPQKYECTYELTSDGRAAGPFTKRGTGRLALYGQQGWGVATRVEGGTLRAVDSGSVPQGIDLAVESGATLELQYGDLSVSSLSGLGTITSSNAVCGNVTLASGGTIGVVADDIVSGGKGPMTLAVGKLTLAGPTTVVVADPEAILSHDGKIVILTAADGIELASGASLRIDPACGLDGKWNVAVSGQTIALSPVKAMTIILR